MGDCEFYLQRDCSLYSTGGIRAGEGSLLCTNGKSLFLTRSPTGRWSHRYWFERKDRIYRGPVFNKTKKKEEKVYIQSQTVRSNSVAWKQGSLLISFPKASSHDLYTQHLLLTERPLRRTRVTSANFFSIHVNKTQTVLTSFWQTHHCLSGL